MKKTILALSLLALVSGCDDFLNTESFTDKNMGNFPQTSEDIHAMVTGIYAVQVENSNVIKNHPYFVGEAASDFRLGGGGPSALEVQALDRMMVSSMNQFLPLWESRYKGIYRANQVLENIDRVTFESEEQRNEYLGQAYYMRALFYWELAQTFETVPLVLTTEQVNLPKAQVDELYAQIGSDFIQAITLLPNKPYHTYDPGRGTRWSAQGFLGRVYQFYTGYYHQDLNAGMPLLEGRLSKDQMIAYLQDCIDHSGHGLVDKFGNLFVYSNAHTKPDYPYAQEKGLSWAGEDNKEVMYSYKYSTLGSGTPNNAAQRNLFAHWEALSASKLKLPQTFPYGQGWCALGVLPSCWEYWQTNNPDDPRKLGSFIDLAHEVPNFNPLGMKSWEETMYRSKKRLPITAKNPSDGKVFYCFTSLEWGVPSTNKSYIFDFVVMRYAEILLMQAELKQDASYLNQVRSRAGMPDVAYSEENLRKERIWELSFEGVRWNDLRRWHIAPAELDKQVGQTAYNVAKEAKVPALAGGYSARYQATGGFFMIPQSQIQLSGGVLVQNKGWEAGVDFTYTGWK